MKLKTARIFTLALFIAAPALLFARVEGTFDRNLTVNGPVDMDVSTGSGNIKVTPGGAGTVHIHGLVKIGEEWFGGSNANDKLQKIIQNPPIEQNGNIIHIGRIDDPELRRNISISYEIVVPADTRLSSKTGSGDQTVDGIRGPLQASTGSGNMHLSGIGGEVRASTGSGDVELADIKSGARASTGSGNIKGHGIGGAIEASTGSGDVVLEQTAPGNARVSTGSGNVELRGVKGTLVVGTGSGDVRAEGEPTGDWKVETGSGNVNLQLPSNAGFDLYARSSSGRIMVDQPITMQGNLNNKKEVRGKVRGGGYMVELRTGSGDIDVK
jgi:Putative adhesin